MINRIVKLTFNEEHIAEFKQIFKVSSGRIIASAGCHSVRLLQSEHDPRIFFTYSIWDDVAALDAYRSTDFFRSTWSKCKKIFADKPEAWSTQVISSHHHEEDIAG